MQAAKSEPDLAALIAQSRALFAAADPLTRARMEWKLGWRLRARPKQLAPPGAWTKLGIVTGRGWGKTETAARWIAEQVEPIPEAIGHVIAPTYSDARFTCFEGPTGILAFTPEALIKSYSADDLVIKFHSGAMIRGFTAEKPSRLRGPQCWFAWVDELASMSRAQEMWDMMMFGLRLGPHPRVMFTTTPRPTPIMRALMKDPTCIIVRGSTFENRANLAPSFFDELNKYDGTTIGRQELLGELLDPEEQGIVKRSQIRMWSASKPLPWFDYIVMSLDTALTEETRDKDTGDPDYTACQVWGLFQHEKRANAMLLDAWQARLGFPELIKRVKDELKSEYGQMETPILRPLIGPAQVALEVKKIDLLLIEDIGSGKSLRQVLASQDIQAFAYNPGRAKKLDRLHAVSHLFAGGTSGVGVVWMTEGRRREKDGTYSHTGDFSSWAHQVLDQLCTFSGEGSIPHDDHVDSATQALRLLSDRNMLDLVRNVPDGRVPEARPSHDAPPNPYAA